MVGRTPEYLGKKIEQKEVKMAMLAVLVLAASILLFSGGGIVAHFAKNAWIESAGTGHRQSEQQRPARLSEILYAYTSGTGNNGSAFAGISANTPWFNITIGLAMLIGRFLLMIPLLAVAGSLAQKKMVPVSAGTFPTHGAAVRRLAGGRHRDRRRADLLPGALAGSDCRALPDATTASCFPSC